MTGTLMMLILTYMYAFVMESDSRVLVGDCELKQGDVCKRCDRNSSDFCPIRATFRLSRINKKMRKYSYRWFFNDIYMNMMKMTINPNESIYNEYSGRHTNMSCSNRSVCAVQIQTYLNIPRPSSKLNTNGKYTIRITVRTTPKEETSCSTLICENATTVESPDEGKKGKDTEELPAKETTDITTKGLPDEEKGGKVTEGATTEGLPEITGVTTEGTDEILTKDKIFFIYILIGAVPFLILLFVGIMRYRKASDNRSPQSQDAKRQISDEGTVVLNQTYASDRQNETSIYEELLDLESMKFNYQSSSEYDGEDVTNNEGEKNKHYQNAQVAKKKKSRKSLQQQGKLDTKDHMYQNIRNIPRLTSK